MSVKTTPVSAGRGHSATPWHCPSKHGPRLALSDLIHRKFKLRPALTAQGDVIEI